MEFAFLHLNNAKKEATAGPGAGRSASCAKEHFVVKVQVPLFHNFVGDGALMYYNEDRSVSGSVGPDEELYRPLVKAVQEEGFEGCKAYFYALWDGTNLAINPVDVQPMESW